MPFPFITYGMMQYRVAQKKRNGILPTVIYLDGITNISVCGNFS